ncbi:hypothetical protein NX059_009274 [Plenodomus lindquistii]|nr:hypothetical protein NX059_009274 [Plenodomus lindquistii]
MNADAYLRKQGWRGSGHSLDSTDRGIKKPLLIAHKQDQLGLGKKKAAYTTDDQWWMRAYDQSLQSIGTGKESTLNQIRTQGVNRGGLYGFFVKGEDIKGTIEDSSATTTDASVPPSGTSTPATSASDTEGASTMKKSDKKRKREETEAPDPNTKSSKSKKDAKSAKKAAKKATKNDAEAQNSSSASPDSKAQAAVTAKLAKMKPAEKAEYQTRASEKGQTLEEYVLRRIQKKAEKHAK